MEDGHLNLPRRMHQPEKEQQPFEAESQAANDFITWLENQDDLVDMENEIFSKAGIHRK